MTTMSSGVALLHEGATPTFTPDGKAIYGPSHGEAAQAGHHAHPRRFQMNHSGLWLFFFSESFLFGSLLAARFYIGGVSHPHELNQFLGLVITSILLFSSITAFQGEVAFKAGETGLAMAWISATILLGVIFAGGVAYEWSTAHFHVGEPYGTAFFAMTGLHASHVISGVGLLALVMRLVTRGNVTPDSSWGLEAAVKYWHFVDVVWVVFYPALYLLSW